MGRRLDTLENSPFKWTLRTVACVRVWAPVVGARAIKSGGKPRPIGADLVLPPAQRLESPVKIQLGDM